MQFVRSIANEDVNTTAVRAFRRFNISSTITDYVHRAGVVVDLDFAETYHGFKMKTIRV